MDNDIHDKIDMMVERLQQVKTIAYEIFADTDTYYTIINNIDDIIEEVETARPFFL